MCGEITSENSEKTSFPDLFTLVQGNTLINKLMFVLL